MKWRTTCHTLTDVSASGISRRLQRLRDQRVRGGLLTVEEAAALASVGFEPVTEVIGAVANNVIPYGFYSSGAVPFQRQTFYNQPVATGWSGNWGDVRTYTSSSNSRVVGTPNSIIALKDGYRTALRRLHAEAQAAGADGVVGVTMQRSVTHGNGGQLWSFLAVGTAVRSTGSTHTTDPFLSGLTAAQSAASIRSGWLPLAVLINPVMAIRWVDPASRWSRQGLAANAEIDAYTDVVNTCRHQARADFERAAATVKADGAVMSSMTLELDAPRDESTCTALVTITGTALARFRLPTPVAAPLMIMPLYRGQK